MHELSIVSSIIEIAVSEAMAAKASRIDAIELEMGTMNGVEMDAFWFAWEQATPHTLLENVRPTIHTKAGMANCLNCHQSFAISHYADACPHCSSHQKKIVQGQELRVAALTITT
jgi:hydrogenase nickel incorporation protein HypA/HybF